MTRLLQHTLKSHNTDGLDYPLLTILTAIHAIAQDSLQASRIGINGLYFVLLNSSIKLYFSCQAVLWLSACALQSLPSWLADFQQAQLRRMLVPADWLMLDASFQPQWRLPFGWIPPECIRELPCLQCEGLDNTIQVDHTARDGTDLEVRSQLSEYWQACSIGTSTYHRHYCLAAYELADCLCCHSCSTALIYIPYGMHMCVKPSDPPTRYLHTQSCQWTPYCASGAMCKYKCLCCRKFA